MRFITFSSILAVICLNHVATAATCESYCESVDDCKNDPDDQGSYCKSWQNPSVCFGLYYFDDSETTMCFQPNASGECPETRPVRCPEPPVDRCQALCEDNLSCRTDPHAHGSYCKYWQNPSVCFGLYYTDDSRTGTCFQPVDGETCPETLPVECIAEPLATTEAPVSPTTTEAPAAPTTTVAVGARAARAAAGAFTTARPVVTTKAATVAPAPTTRAATTTTTTKAATTTTTTKAATTAIPRPTGRYEGRIAAITMWAAFHADNTVSVSFSLGPRTCSGNHLPYTFDGTRVGLVNEPATMAFLGSCPVALNPDQITITYDAAADEAIAAFFGLRIRGVKVPSA